MKEIPSPCRNEKYTTNALLTAGLHQWQSIILKAKSVVWMLGSITSRLAADTTTVSDQICLNINVIARSLTQAAMVLIFMVNASWRLTVVTFIMLPSTMFICRVVRFLLQVFTSASALDVGA